MKKIATIMGSSVTVSVILLFLIMGALTGSITSQNSQEACGDPSPVVATDKDMTENAKQVYVAVKQAFPEVTPQGLCGMLGNFQQESTISPKAIQNSNPTSGHGLAQWTATRCIALMNFAQEKGKPWDDLGVQIEYLILELKGAESGAISALKETSVESATAAWQEKFERAGEPVLQNRLTYANHWYSVFSTDDPVSGSTLGNTTDGSDPIACSSGTDTSDIVTVAKAWLGWFHYPHPDTHSVGQVGGDPLNPDKEGTTDCSGFVWLVLNKAKCNVPADMGWFTGTMTTDAKGEHKYFKQVSESEAQAGDVVIVNLGAGVGSSGHTGILTEKWKGKDTKIIQEGGNGDRVNIDAFGTSFTSLLTGGDVCLARPIKK